MIARACRHEDARQEPPGVFAWNNTRVEQLPDDEHDERDSDGVARPAEESGTGPSFAVGRRRAGRLAAVAAGASLREVAAGASLRA